MKELDEGDFRHVYWKILKLLTTGEALLAAFLDRLNPNSTTADSGKHKKNAKRQEDQIRLAIYGFCRKLGKNQLGKINYEKVIILLFFP